MNKTGLYWLGNDLRRHDNLCLIKASEKVEHLLIIFCIDEKWLGSGQYNQPRMAIHRRRFLAQCLKALKNQLSDEGQQLIIITGNPVVEIPKFIRQYEVSHVFRSRHPAYDEQVQWRLLKSDANTNENIIEWHEIDNLSLINYRDIKRLTGIYNWGPVANKNFDDFTPSFSKFRRLIEKAIKSSEFSIDLPLKTENPLPKSVPFLPSNYQDLASSCVYDIDQSLGINISEEYQSIIDDGKKFYGGEETALKHINCYFSSTSAHRYKSVRNTLDGWNNSTKFSPWLANGCISARQITDSLHTFEKREGRSDSSYWIFFELLWREYFFWYAYYYQKSLFQLAGIHRRKPLSSFYPERFKSWTEGTTIYPIVNACMKQLKKTGYMSNRGRQIVASCFINELNLDWRYGAAYFESQLIDYDVGSNWGNWQYLAGVGADPRSTQQGGRHFDLSKQRRRYDPNGDFIIKWLGPHALIDSDESSIDHIDPTGWPIQ